MLRTMTGTNRQMKLVDLFSHLFQIGIVLHDDDPQWHRCVETRHCIHNNLAETNISG
jgi:hypothetical protein